MLQQNIDQEGLHIPTNQKLDKIYSKTSEQKSNA